MDNQFTELFVNASLPDGARLHSISSPHSSAWLPSLRLSLHLDPSELQVAIISGGYGLPSVKVSYVPNACPIHCTTLVTMPCHAKMALMWFNCCRLSQLPVRDEEDISRTCLPCFMTQAAISRTCSQHN